MENIINNELLIELEDTQWPFSKIDHDRKIARAIVIDKESNYYFVRIERNDVFGKATLIETSGGGVEEGEDVKEAIIRELKEELGVDAEIFCKIGVVSDYYNKIYRHNINHFFLCRIKDFGEKNMTQDEIESFHMQTLCLKYDEAIREYEKCSNTKLGRLIANREIPILKRAQEIIENQ